MRPSCRRGYAGGRMKARNDAVVEGVALATVLARLLPRIPRRRVPKARISSPEAGLLRFGVGGAFEDVTSHGVWQDTAETSAPFLRRALGRKPPPLVRLVFHDGVLALNNMTITARIVTGRAMRRAADGAAQARGQESAADLPLWQAAARRPDGRGDTQATEETD
jgi:hypothetical protein